MPAKLKTIPRKQPRQDRAKETVESILEATAHILIQEGYDRASTNKIAKRAGVSVGSLYQYFPSKEALVAALIDQHLSEAVQVLGETLPKVALLRLPEAVRTLIAAMLKVHRHNPKLHQVLIEQVPRVGRLKRIEDLEAQSESLVSLYLAPRWDELAPKNLPLAVFLLNSAVQAAAHKLAFAPDGRFDEEETVDELSNLVIGYLAPDQVARARSAAKPPARRTRAGPRP